MSIHEPLDGTDSIGEMISVISRARSLKLMCMDQESIIPPQCGLFFGGSVQRGRLQSGRTGPAGL